MRLDTLNFLSGISVIIGTFFLSPLAQSATKSKVDSLSPEDSTLVISERTSGDEDKPRAVTIVAVGDVMLGEHLNETLKSKKSLLAI